MYGPAASETIPRESYAAELVCRVEAAHDKLSAQQLQLRMGDRQKEPSFKAGQLVLLRTKRFFLKSRATNYRPITPVFGKKGSQKPPLRDRTKWLLK